MDTGTVIGVFAASAVFIGLGVFCIVMAIKALASRSQPDIRANGRQVGKKGLPIFIILGGLATVVGVALLIMGIKGAAG